ncbi:hypothetical protein P5673_008822 [Acropora cervicornis]|uniref:Uncharacterized protein n=1 Tax=Acropora cervicornis TaxID=6130 RepID=A0AAD9QTC2_ACRCE|nr:hypothetical protein P5673_008822 [Acropora cervicornis]
MSQIPKGLKFNSHVTSTMAVSIERATKTTNASERAMKNLLAAAFSSMKWKTVKTDIPDVVMVNSEDEGKRFGFHKLIAFVKKEGFVYNISPDSCPSKEELFTGKLKMDTAFVNITSTLNYSINVEGISSDCYEVLKTDVVKNTFIIVKTHYRFKLVIKSGSRSLCSLEYLFGERGLYEFIVKPNITCDLKEVKSPEKSYMPLWIAFIALVGAALLWVVLTVIVSLSVD